MSLFSYHLVELSLIDAFKALVKDPISEKTNGLIHAEYMTTMTLGSAVVSTSRFLIRKVAVFAQWEDETALVNFLENDPFGIVLAKGWHLRLSFVRKWGSFAGFDIPSVNNEHTESLSPAVAVTIARMRPFEVPRFINWGRPVEKLVRDHPGTTISLASIKFPNTVSTFSVWKTDKEMTDMVHGHSKVPRPKRHAQAMKERDRKDFHFEFTTLRFKPLSEHGSWKGRSDYTTNLK